MIIEVVVVASSGSGMVMITGQGVAYGAAKDGSRPREMAWHGKIGHGLWCCVGVLPCQGRGGLGLGDSARGEAWCIKGVPQL